MLQYAPQELKRAEEMVGMQIITVPLQTEETLKKANNLIEVCSVLPPPHQHFSLNQMGMCLKACIGLIYEVAMNKYKQPIPRNSFNLRYRINNTISILETYLCAKALLHDGG